MRAIDSNVLVRLLVRDDAKQAVAAEAFTARGAWVPHLVLAEVTWVLSSVYERDPEAIANAVEILLNHQNLTLQDPGVVASALGSFRKWPSLGFSDCLVVEVSRKAGNLPLGTFDRDLGKLKGAERLL